MIGRNRFVFNDKQMRAAVEFYLKNSFLAESNVHVEQVSQIESMDGPEFHIEVIPFEQLELPLED